MHVAGHHPTLPCKACMMEAGGTPLSFDGGSPFRVSFLFVRQIFELSLRDEAMNALALMEGLILHPVAMLLLGVLF